LDELSRSNHWLSRQHQSDWNCHWHLFTRHGKGVVEMSIAMDGSDESAGCTCDVGLTKSQLEFLRTELTKWLNEQHLTFQPEQWRKGFHEAMRIALANIMLLTEPKIPVIEEIEEEDE